MELLQMRNWTLRARLVSGVGIVVVLAMVALGLVFTSLLSSLDQELFKAIRARAEANAVAIATDMAFDIAAAQDKEATERLAQFLGKHGEVHGIATFDAARKPFVAAGAELDARKLLDGFGKLTEVKSKVVGDLVIAAAACEGEGDAG